MMWKRIIWLFLLFMVGRHIGYPASPRYIELADSADFFMAHQNWDRAEKTIVEALRLEPANFSNSLLLSNLGLIQANKGEYHKALQSLSLGLNIAPSSTVLLNNRAHTYLMLDSVTLASEDLDRSLQIDSVQEWTLQTRGFLYLQHHDFQKAEEIFIKIKKEFPRNSSVLSGLAAISEYEGNINKAIDYYQQALSINPDDDEAREAYIMALIKTNNYTEARVQIRKGLDINSENATFYLLRGYLHRLNFRLDEAQADKKIAISKGLDPKYVSNFIP